MTVQTSTRPRIEKHVTRVFKENARSTSPIVVNIGGARSTKSHSIAQLLIQRLMGPTKRKILVTRKTFPALRITAYRLVIDLLAEYGIYTHLHHDKVSHMITAPWTGSFIVFASIDDPNKIKSTEFNDVWMEEANEFDWEDFTVLRTRMSAKNESTTPNQMFLSNNPSDEQGWINQKLLNDPAFKDKVHFIHSTYKDNPFLSPEYIKILEDLKDQDPTAYAVYAEGKYATRPEIIYPPFTMLNELPEPDKCDEVIYGLDFGFNNPSALVEIRVKDQNLYLKELLYKTNLTNQDLIGALKESIPEQFRDRPIYADSAEPQRIQEIYQAGFNIHSAQKDVKLGIDTVRRFNKFTTPENVNLNKEVGAYRWKLDKNGNRLEEPVKFMEHLCDGFRYAIFTHFDSSRIVPEVYVG